MAATYNYNNIPKTTVACSFTPREIEKELDKYIVGQNDAKRAVAIALRNRWRRNNLPDDIRSEVHPKNILLIGPTGVGKTEIARRLSKLVNAPFIKVEATKFTEIGYVGRDVEAIIRDLVDIAAKQLKEKAVVEVRDKAMDMAVEKLLDIMLPKVNKFKRDEPTDRKVANVVSSNKNAVFTTTEKQSEDGSNFNITDVDTTKDSGDNKDQDGSNGTSMDGDTTSSSSASSSTSSSARELFKQKLLDGELDEKIITIEVSASLGNVSVDIMVPPGMEELTNQLQGMLSGLGSSGKKKKKKMKVVNALRLLCEEEANTMINDEDVIAAALDYVEQNGIVFIDEIDKITRRGEEKIGTDVSREGVQRDLLPLVEGCTVSTKHGLIKTDYILFIASGAFHLSKPSDLIPELQGRFPIRVELNALGVDDFCRILTEPKASLIQQYIAMMKTENLDITFEADAIRRLAEIAFKVNEKTENIGARRLYTIMEKLLEEISFTAPEESSPRNVIITKDYVDSRLSKLVDSGNDVGRYIL